MPGPRAALAALLLVALACSAYLAAGLPAAGRDEGRVIRALLCAAAQRAWEEVIELFERETGVRVEPVYGSSGRLLAMLAAGVEADVFAPAAPRYIVRAIERGLVDPSTVRPVAFLVPVIAVPAGNPGRVTSVYDLARPGLRVVLADESAAVGAYAREVLSRLGLGWVADRAVKVDTFSRLAALIAVGAADASIAWHVIAHWYPGRVEVVPLPRSVTVASWIPVAVTTSARDREAALAFVEFVSSDPRARAVLESMGYIVDVREALRHASEVEAYWLLRGSR